jgi:hypothetical protein
MSGKNGEKDWSCGPITIPRKSGHIYLFDKVKDLDPDQLGALLQEFELPRHAEVPRSEEEFVLVACLQHRWQVDTQGGASPKVEQCRQTYVGRYRQIIEKAEKGEIIVATKKSKKNGSKKEKAGVGARGRMYEISEREPKELGPQAKIVYDAVKKVGPAQPAVIAKEAEGKLTTRQGAERVVAFYLASFKKSGYVRTTDPTKAA